MYCDCVCLFFLFDKVMSVVEVVDLIQDGMIVGMSGFICVGEVKVVFQVLVMCVKECLLCISLMIGVSFGNDFDKQFIEVGVFVWCMLFQVDSILCKVINVGEVMFIDQYFLEIVEQLCNYQLKLLDIVVIEVVVIIEQGYIVLIILVGNLVSFVIFVKQVIVEINLVYSINLEGLYDIYILIYWLICMLILLICVDDCIGSMVILILLEKIVVIVINDQLDLLFIVLLLDGEIQVIVNYLIDFFKCEVDVGCMSNSFGLLQVGIGSIVNVVMCGLIELLFENLIMYFEVLQDLIFDLIDVGKLCFVLGSLIILLLWCNVDVFGNLECYKDKLVLCLQEIFNYFEVVCCLGIIGINMVLEFDIYGNVNLIYVGGIKMMNGIGGFGDFVCNVYLVIFVIKLIVKGGNIFSVVLMVSYVDYIEYDVDIFVIEQGFVDLCGLVFCEWVWVIIENCVYLFYQVLLLDYFEVVCVKGGYMLYLLCEVLVWYLNLEECGYMLVG